MSIHPMTRELFEPALAAIVQALPDPACIIDGTGSIVTLNASYASRFGNTVTECIGTSVHSLISTKLSPDQAQSARTTFDRVSTTGIPEVHEASAGSQIVRVSISPVTIEAANLPVLLIVVQDITRQKHTDASLSNSIRRLEMALEIVKAGICEMQVETGACTWSDTAWKLFGLEKEAATPSMQLFFSRIHPDDRGATENTIEAAIRNGKNFSIEYRVCHPDGTVHWIQSRATPLRESDGSVLKFIGLVIDITEQKLVELEELKHRRHMDYALEKSHVGVWDLNLENQTAKRTLEHARIFGYDSNLPEWSFRKFLDHIIPEDRNEVEQLITRSQKAKTDYAFECRIRRTNGDVRWISVTGLFFCDQTSHEAHVLGIVQDITERKNIEAEHELLENQLRQSQKLELLGQLAGGIAHDFNNHLTAILGHTELILNETDESLPFLEQLKFIYDAATHSSELTRQLLAIARKQPIKPQLLDLNREIRQMLPMISRLVGKHIRFDLLLGTGKALLCLDPSQLYQILMNLCINASDAITGTGIVTIRTESVQFDAGTGTKGLPPLFPGDYIRLVVTDTGSGIDEKTLPHIFEPFFTTKDAGKGTGLGLSTIYGIIKQNRGHIDCTSGKGKGTTFTIYLPRYAGPGQERVAMADGDIAASSGMATILLVDDEAEVLNLVQHLLKKHDFFVLTAPDAETALSIASRYPNRIDLLLTDIRLPNMSGFALSRRLTVERPEMKSLLMSGYADWTTDDAPMQKETVDFISKPFSTKDLLSAIRKSLELT